MKIFTRRFESLPPKTTKNHRYTSDFLPTLQSYIPVANGWGRGTTHARGRASIWTNGQNLGGGFYSGVLISTHTHTHTSTVVFPTIFFKKCIGMGLDEAIQLQIQMQMANSWGKIAQRPCFGK